MGGTGTTPSGAPNAYNPLAWFVGEPVIGEGTWIGPFCVVDGSGGLTIGAGCDLAAGVHVYTHSTAARCVTGRAVETERAAVVIGDRTFIGANAVVLMGVTIGSGCVVAAGAVVTDDVPDGVCVAGVPARVVGRVDPSTGRVHRHESSQESGEHLDDPGLVAGAQPGVHGQGEVAGEEVR